MHLVYIDESGNSGNNLGDDEQPIFVLGALIVPESCWQAVEADLEAKLAETFPKVAVEGAEVHAGDLRGSRGCFKGASVDSRVALRDAWLRVASQHGLKFVYRSIDKKRYQRWMQNQFGLGVTINPHIAAFPLVSMVVNQHLLSENARGMFISDENKEIVRDVEKSIRLLRWSGGPLRLSQIIEKGFFIDSSKSRVLQLCDMCVLHARKKAEAESGRLPKPFDVEGIKLLEPLILRGNELFGDVIAWLRQQQGPDGGGQQK